MLLLHVCSVQFSSAQSCPTLCNPMNCTFHGILQARILEWVASPFSKGSSQPRDRIQVSLPALQADSLPTEPQGKPKNTGVGSLSLLQWIFPSQELNRGLLHCRQILYQLSYQGSPDITKAIAKSCFLDLVLLQHQKNRKQFLCENFSALGFPSAPSPGSSNLTGSSFSVSFAGASEFICHISLLLHFVRALQVALLFMKHANAFLLLPWIFLPKTVS